MVTSSTARRNSSGRSGMAMRGGRTASQKLTRLSRTKPPARTAAATRIFTVYDLRRAMPEVSAPVSATAWAGTSLLARTLMPALGSVGVNAVRSTIGGVILVAWVLAAAGPGVFAAISPRAGVVLALRSAGG